MRCGETHYRSRFNVYIRIIALALSIAFLWQDIVWANPDVFQDKTATLAQQTLATQEDRITSHQRFVTAYINAEIAKTLGPDPERPQPVTLATIEKASSYILESATRNGLKAVEIPSITGNAISGEIKITFANGNGLVFYNPRLSAKEGRLDIPDTQKIVFDAEINKYLRKQYRTTKPADAAPLVPTGQTIKYSVAIPPYRIMRLDGAEITDDKRSESFKLKITQEGNRNSLLISILRKSDKICVGTTYLNLRKNRKEKWILESERTKIEDNIDGVNYQGRAIFPKVLALISEVMPPDSELHIKSLTEVETLNAFAAGTSWENTRMGRIFGRSGWKAYLIYPTDDGATTHVSYDTEGKWKDFYDPPGCMRVLRRIVRETEAEKKLEDTELAAISVYLIKDGKQKIPEERFPEEKGMQLAPLIQEEVEAPPSDNQRLFSFMKDAPKDGKSENPQLALKYRWISLWLGIVAAYIAEYAIKTNLFSQWGLNGLIVAATISAIALLVGWVVHELGHKTGKHLWGTHTAETRAGPIASFGLFILTTTITAFIYSLASYTTPISALFFAMLISASASYFVHMFADNQALFKIWTFVKAGKHCTSSITISTLRDMIEAGQDEDALLTELVMVVNEAFEEKNLPDDKITKMKEQIKKMSKNGVVLVATSGGKVVGHTSVEITNISRCYMVNLAVLPDYQFQGIGTALMNSIIEWSRRLELDYLLFNIVEKRGKVSPKRFYKKYIRRNMLEVVEEFKTKSINQQSNVINITLKIPKTPLDKWQSRDKNSKMGFINKKMQGIIKRVVKRHKKLSVHRKAKELQWFLKLADSDLDLEVRKYSRYAHRTLRKLFDMRPAESLHKTTDMGSFEEIHFTVIPDSHSDNVSVQFEDCLEQIKGLCQEKGVGLENVVKQDAFLRAETNEEFQRKSALLEENMRKFYSDNQDAERGRGPPSTSFIGEIPDNFNNTTMECTIIVPKQDSDVKIERKTVNDISYTVVTENGVKWVYAGGFSYASEVGIGGQSQKALEAMEAILDEEGLEFSDIVRQWNYIEDIVGFEDGRQKYQIFNNVRGTFYRLAQAGFEKLGYPAATGIGMNAGSVVLSFTACKTKREDVAIIPIANPLQVSAHSYSTRFLKGKSKVKTTPKFERAKAVVKDGIARIFVSGTAGIRGQKTKNLGSVEKQTRMTIENIEYLIARGNLEDKGIDAGATLGDLSQVRVYVKRTKDMVRVQQMCEKMLPPGTPIQYVVCDVCRPGLLVEIEAIATVKGKIIQDGVAEKSESQPIDVRNYRRISKFLGEPKVANMLLNRAPAERRRYILDAYAIIEKIHKKISSLSDEDIAVLLPTLYDKLSDGEITYDATLTQPDFAALLGSVREALSEYENASIPIRTAGIELEVHWALFEEGKQPDREQAKEYSRELQSLFLLGYIPDIYDKDIRDNVPDEPRYMGICSRDSEFGIYHEIRTRPLHSSKALAYLEDRLTGEHTFLKDLSHYRTNVSIGIEVSEDIADAHPNIMSAMKGISFPILFLWGRWNELVKGDTTEIVRNGFSDPVRIRGGHGDYPLRLEIRTPGNHPEDHEATARSIEFVQVVCSFFEEKLKAAPQMAEELMAASKNPLGEIWENYLRKLEDIARKHGIIEICEPLSSGTTANTAKCIAPGTEWYFWKGPFLARIFMDRAIKDTQDWSDTHKRRASALGQDLNKLCREMVETVLAEEETPDQIEQNAEAIAPELAHALMTLAKNSEEENEDTVLLLDTPPDEFKNVKALIENHVIKTLKNVKVNNATIEQVLRRLEIVGSDKIGVIEGRIANGKVKPQNVIVVTSMTNLKRGIFDNFRTSEHGEAFITALNHDYVKNPPGSYYYPYLEAVFFAVTRAINNDKSNLWECYKKIPNINGLTEENFVELLFTQDAMQRRRFCLDLAPDAKKFTDDLQKTYERIEEFLRKA